ncbi:trypsin-like peptidase domain-containing protein [Brevibacillus centrosporus]|uniref:Trypsin-like peptidase domain-containing protein n=2 Tax=Brevibacillus centrosporus TaxID=54910 RepID=A0A1I3VWB6_9BACL|nr:trypsin-like peptidase domain-containing protein [Brevibacillus centrosporus]SFJ99439.1 Trypsin-like peptidase domain-containing protein [Brevibacillus centrosporus]
MKSKKWSQYTRVKYPVSSSSLHPFNFFVPIVERVQEGVVSIVTEDAPHSKNMDSLIRSLINEEETPSTTERSFGSGFLFHPKGYILTSEHVIGKSKNIYVKLFNGRVFEAQRILSDRVRDYAVIKIDADCKLYPLALGNSSHTKVGEWVISVGSPLVAIEPKSAARSALPSPARGQLHLFGQPLRFFLNQVTGILYGSANGFRV